jgi:predicted dehydrogenase
MSKDRALRVAVIGGGNIAQRHLEVLRDLPEAALTTLVDTHPKTLEETADRFGVPERRRSHADLLAGERPDAVFVLVSVLKMAEVASDFLRAGIPTFLEKPPGLYTRQTRRLADLARSHHTPAMVGVNRRFYSSLLKGREALLASGPIRSVTVEAHEDVRRVRENPKFPDEVLRRWGAANGIHALDLLRYFGGEVSDIRATQATVEGPMPDCCSALLRFEGGASGRAVMDWFAPGRHRVEARGVGVAFSAFVDGEAVLWRRGESPQVVTRDEIDLRYKAGFYRQDRTFLEWVRDGGDLPFPGCSLDDAVKTMEMIDAISGHR